MAKLTEEERELLTICEAAIEQGTDLLALGNALAGIKEHELYREWYPSFEEYLTLRWGADMNPHRAKVLRALARLA